MRVADSGMPEAGYWNSLFDVPVIVDWLGLARDDDVVEVGCGYGTFSVPVAARCRELVAFDIDQDMLGHTARELADAGAGNVRRELRDVVADGTGLPDDDVDMVLLFNILHFPERRLLLAEAARILRPGGRVAVIHWRKDMDTPRGPAPESRPDRAAILDAVRGLPLGPGPDIVLPPYHWGIQLVKE